MKFLLLFLLLGIFAPGQSRAVINLNLDYPSFGNADLNCEDFAAAKRECGIKYEGKEKADCNAAAEKVPYPNCAQSITTLVAWVYAMLVGISGLAAFAVLSWGGIEWMTSSGDSGKIGSAKEKFWGAFIGILLILSSYLILEIINPDLVSSVLIF